jgi:hypothetical protein
MRRKHAAYRISLTEMLKQEGRTFEAMLGGGKRVLPSNLCGRLNLLDERRFTNGVVYLR